MDNEAKLNITVGGENGDLSETVSFDASDADVKSFASEAVAAGSVRGIRAQVVDFTDFVVDRFPAKDDLPSRLVLRPKTPFGS